MLTGASNKMEAKVKPSDLKVPWPNDTDESKNISGLWSDYTQSTGLHGINKVSLGTRYRFRSLWWTIAVLTMTGYLVFNVYKELSNYYEYPTVTVLKARPTESIVLPAVTICNQSPINRSKAREVDPSLEDYFLKTSALSNMYQPINWSDPSYGPLYRTSLDIDWWQEISMEPKIMYYMCKFGGRMFNCMDEANITLTDFGLCATFNGNPANPRRAHLYGSENNFILNVRIDQNEYMYGQHFATGLWITIHDQHQHPDASSTSFLASPGMATYAALKKRTFKYLPEPYKAFDSVTCVDTKAPTFRNSLSNYDNYTMEHCLLECTVKKTIEICQCRKVTFKYLDYPVCSLMNITTCFVPELRNLRLNPEFLKSCKCDIQCEFNIYDVKTSTARFPANIWNELIVSLNMAPNTSFVSENYLEVRVYFETLMIETTEQKPQYTTETIIGNLGGHMGICLGASILTLTEIMELLCILVMSLFRKSKKVGEKSRRTHYDNSVVTAGWVGTK